MARGDRSDATRIALLGAGARVFTRRGVYGATIREIVEEAGYSTPVLYYHFRDKEDLYGEIVRTEGERYRALIESELRTAETAAARLTAIARGCVRFGQEDRGRLRVFYAEIFGERPQLKPGIDGLRDWTLRLIEQTFEEGKESGELVIDDVARACRLFVALISGLLVEQADQRSLLLEDALGEDVVAVLLHIVGGLEAKER